MLMQLLTILRVNFTRCESTLSSAFVHRSNLDPTAMDRSARGLKMHAAGQDAQGFGRACPTSLQAQLVQGVEMRERAQHHGCVHALQVLQEVAPHIVQHLPQEADPICKLNSKSSLQRMYVHVGVAPQKSLLRC